MKKLFLLFVALLAGPACAQWHYETKKDPMTDVVTTRAWIESPTTVQLAFPYNHGKTGARLYVRGNGLGVVTNDGQLMESEGITLRFDEDEPIHLDASGPADGTSQVLWISPTHNQIKKESGATTPSG